MHRLVAALVWLPLAACSDPDPKESTDPPPPNETAQACVTAVTLDTRAPSATIGDGTPASCTQAAAQEALSKGGVIAFSCGAAPYTLTLTSTLTVKKETVLDGNGLVTLSGGGSKRILVLDSGYDQTGPRLTVQRLTFKDGYGPTGIAGGEGGGGAIYRDGGSLTVIDSVFVNNRGPETGQDAAGGAIYAFGGGETVIVGSVFQGNSSSNGGAVGSLNGDLTIVNSTFVDNTASGTGGNPGNGGCGGTIYQDGGDEKTQICGIAVRGSRANAIGGAIFRVSNDDSGSFEMNRSTIDGSVVANGAKSNAGGLYLQGLAVTMSHSTVSRNQANFAGGIWLSKGSASLTNVTVAGNTARTSHGGGFWLGNNPTGTLLNCTIANNSAAGSDSGMGAIFGSGLTLKNTVIADNTVGSTWGPLGCDKTQGEGGGNVGWPNDSRGEKCSPNITVADPKLGPLAENGGPTMTLLPGAGSSARARGTGCPATDQRGNPRKEPCTAGAVEVP